MNICSKCKKELQDGIQVCDNCGTLLVGDEKDSGSEQTVKKKSLLVPVLIGAGTLVLLIVTGAFFIIKSGVSEKKETEWTIKKELYVKDEELFVSDMPGKKGMRLTSELLKGKDGDMKEWYSTDYNKISYSIDITDDNKRVFFPDKFDGKSYTLYYNDTGKSSKEKVKIDSDLSEDSLYFVSSDGNIVTYFKEDDSELYQYNISKNEKTKIDSDLGNGLFSIYLESEGKEVYYIKEGGDFYLKKAGKDKEKIDDDVEEILASNLVYDKDETSGVFYLKEGNVYKKENGKEKEKLVSDVDNVAQTYLKQNSFYYTKEKKGSAVLLMDYVEDDMKESDAAIEKPKEAPQAPSMLEYSSTEEYEEALGLYDRAKEEYNKALDEYRDKEKRDKLRQELNKEEYESKTTELYYYDGKEEKKLSDNLYNIESRAFEEPVIVFITRKSDDNDKIKLSEIKNIEDVRSQLKVYKKGDVAIAVGGKVIKIEEDDIQKFQVSYNGARIYFFKDIKEDGQEGDLYEISIENAVASEPKLYDKGVYSKQLYLYKSNDLAYFKDYEDEEATLYMNKKKIDTDVYVHNISPRREHSEEVYYYKDYNLDKEEGSLMFYNQNSPQLIADKVHDFKICYDGSVLYLCSYGLGSFKGDLKLYRQGNSSLINKDVMMIIKRFNYVETLMYGF